MKQTAMTGSLPEVNISVETNCPDEALPPVASFKAWAEAVVNATNQSQGNLAIRIVDTAEIQQLNRDFRHQDKPTNVLSFPFDMPEGIEGIDPIIGDLAICAPVVVKEADEQGKPIEAHWAHMVVHGTLHLLGYDHINDDDANIMEELEIALLKRFGFDNPYLI